MRLASARLLLTLSPLLLPMLLTGCVERKFIVQSDPPGAVVLVNNVPLNTYTPADGSWVYPGCYNFSLIKDNFERLEVRQPFPAKWYDYPPLDFVAENLIPWTIEDKRCFGPYPLKPLLMPTAEEVVGRGEAMRQRAQGLGAGKIPAPTPLGLPGGPPPAPVAPPWTAPVPPAPAPSTPPIGLPPP